MVIKPMEPILKSSIIRDKQWIHQVKWDGIRGISIINDKNVNIFTKSGRERTMFYPELHRLSKLLKGKQAILDGEIIVLDNNDRPSFNYSLIRERVNKKSNIDFYAKKYPVKYIVFDILNYNDVDIRNLTFEERKNKLDKFLTQDQTVAITQNFTNGEDLFNLMKKKNWEGIVSKRITSKYIKGKKHNDWYKIKITKKILTVVCGVEWKKDSIKSLVLGIFKEGRFYYIGKASLGLNERDKLLIKEYIPKLKEHKNPLNVKLKGKITWFKPLLTCWIKFMEWTNDGHLRHPIIIGFSTENYLEATGEEIIV